MSRSRSDCPKKHRPPRLCHTRPAPSMERDPRPLDVHFGSGFYPPEKRSPERYDRHSDGSTALRTGRGPRAAPGPGDTAQRRPEPPPPPAAASGKFCRERPRRTGARRWAERARPRARAGPAPRAPVPARQPTVPVLSATFPTEVAIGKGGRRGGGSRKGAERPTRLKRAAQSRAAHGPGALRRQLPKWRRQRKAEWPLPELAPPTSSPGGASQRARTEPPCGGGSPTGTASASFRRARPLPGSATTQLRDISSAQVSLRAKPLRQTQRDCACATALAGGRPRTWHRETDRYRAPVTGNGESPVDNEPARGLKVPNSEERAAVVRCLSKPAWGETGAQALL